MPLIPRIVVITIPFVLSALSGCGSGQTQGNFDEGLSPESSRTGPTERSEDAAIINGAMISRDELWANMAELGGGLVLEEMVLDQRLKRELERRAMRITEDDVKAEEAHLLFLVLGGASTDEDEAGRIIDSTRRARGLGPVRYQALLRRNAMLRRLVRDEIAIEQADLERLHAVRYGPKVRARIIVAPNEREAANIRTEIERSGGGRVEFALAAMDHSIDATSTGGGLIEPFSPEDPAYPSVVRQALNRIQPGEMTPVVGLEAGFAILMLEERTEPESPPFDDVRQALMRELRLRQERILMQQLALELIESTQVMAVDRSVSWSWRTRNAAQ